MIVSGKCPPNPKEFNELASEGFENVELYLTRDHLDTYTETLRDCQNAPLNVSSIHTPHVYGHETEYLQLANNLADDLDALLVFHSTAIALTNLNEIEKTINFTAPHAFESSTGQSLLHIENTLFDQCRDLIFDTAHIYTGVGDQDFDAVTDTLLTTYHDQVPLVHLNDATLTQDGLPFGDGTLDMVALSRTLKETYDGIVVLEVMPEHQPEALEIFQNA